MLAIIHNNLDEQLVYKNTLNAVLGFDTLSHALSQFFLTGEALFVGTSHFFFRRHAFRGA